MMAGIENTEPSVDSMEWLIGEPLDTLNVTINGKNGIQKIVPALHIGFMEVREYMHFKLPPVISSDTGQHSPSADEEEWFEYMFFLEDDLHWLLKLPHHRFWSQVVYDEHVHKSLESYLTLAPRDYDITHLKYKEEISAVLKKIHRLVFLVFLRMSTYKESKEHHIRREAYGDIIYDNFIFDVPKLMDICVLYGFQNKALLTKMVKNIFNTQPKYLDDLNETSAIALNAFSFAEEKLFLNVPEKHGGCRKLEDNTPTGIKEMSLSSFCDIIGYITDICATIHMFLEIYSPACRTYYQNGAVIRIVSFYEQTFPPVEKKIMRIAKDKDENSICDIIKNKVMLSKMFLIKAFRNILSYCCIQHILDSNCTEARFSNLTPSEEFLDIFMEVSSEKIFLHDYNAIYPFENDLELLNQTGAFLDPERLSYIFGSIHDIPDINALTFASTPENGARPKTHSKISKSSDKSAKNLQSIAAILKPETNAPYQNGGISSVSNADSKPSELQLDSLVHSVLDVLPHIGEGFIENCLGYFEYDTEKLIDAILTETLPKSLSTLDRNLKRKPKDLNSTTQNINKPSILEERKNVYDNDEFDIFSREDVNMENIHIGKKNKTPNSYQTLKTDEESDFLKNLICTYADKESEDEEIIEDKINLYEDEYDDTYDSALVGLKEPILEDEPDKDEPLLEEVTQSIQEDLREARPDDFCINPEIIRQKREEHLQAKYNARQRGGRRGGSSEQSRQQKDRHKDSIANHNRRKQSDYKKSRGMLSTR